MTPRTFRLIGPALLVATAIVALVWGLSFGGGAAPLVIGDPGPIVRWGLPAAGLVVNLSASAMVGSLVLALWSLRAGGRAFDTALDTASAGAAVFTVAAAATGFLTFLNVFNPELSAGPQFGEQFGRFLLETEVGRAWSLTTIAGALITVFAFAVRGWTTTLLVTGLAVASLVPMATQGHSGDLANHNIAVSAMFLHILGAAVWLGGLALLVILRPQLTRAGLADVLSRYSSLALAAFIVVALSGVMRASIGILSLENLLTPYGIILLVKVAALGAMGVLGAWYRRRVIDGYRADGAPRRFWSLIALELVFMGIASGAAAALGRTPPPVDTSLPAIPSPAEILTRSPLPPELSWERWFTQWDLDPLWFVAGGFGLFFYLAGVRRLRRRGDRWPLYRTVLWIVGVLLLVWITSGPVNAYQDFLFSVHMGGHMGLNMIVPICLVSGAPVTLALRAIRKRDDGTRGGREWILWAVHTPFSKVVTHPLFAAGMFVLSLWVFYYTDLFRWSLADHLGHQWMNIHFLLSGYLFVLSLIGIDPVPLRYPYPFRLITLIAVMAMHAFFGLSIMMHSGLMVADWYGAMGRVWGPTPLEDQYIGGGVAWSVGEIPTLTLAIIVAIQWSRSDDRAQRRSDRHADRTGEEELAAYNARLAKIAERDARQSARH